MPVSTSARALIGERIVVIGNTSSGKSTLAAQLAEVIDGEHVELDALFWRTPGWQPPDPTDFRDAMHDAVDGTPRWVSSGNYLSHGTQDILWPQADTLIWLDMPLPTVLRRVTARSWNRWRDGELLWGTQREDFWTHLKLWTDESLIHFAIRYHHSKRRQYAAEFADPRWVQLRKYRLRSPETVGAFLDVARREAVGG